MDWIIQGITPLILIVIYIFYLFRYRGFAKRRGYRFQYAQFVFSGILIMVASTLSLFAEERHRMVILTLLIVGVVFSFFSEGKLRREFIKVKE